MEYESIQIIEMEVRKKIKIQRRQPVNKVEDLNQLYQ